MLCPVCASKSKVVDCRSDGERKFRMRECKVCHFRWATAESDCDMGEFEEVRNAVHLKNKRKRMGEQLDG